MMKTTNEAALISVGMNSKLITTESLALRYELSTRQVQKMVHAGVLPTVRIGRRCLRFDVAKCDAAIDKFQTRAACLGRKGGQD